MGHAEGTGSELVLLSSPSSISSRLGRTRLSILGIGLISELCDLLVSLHLPIDEDC
jgi:hypothetical protein